MITTVRKVEASTLLTTVAVTVGALEFGAGTASASTRELGAATAAASTRTVGSTVPCLWAGTTHVRGATVVAGGRDFRCETDSRGAPHWSKGGPTNRPSSVPNPGAYAHPVRLFSAGAHQPGTEYTDYCVGNQLIDGADHVYRVVADSKGGLHWKAAGPISDWTFDPDSPRPGPSSRTASLCYDGGLT
ncbi:hypothetical protein ACIBJI_15530 [Nocardia sp. NPDC050408]|uniref:hypothetical protein n=1 Tax=unclassified Nocardia TaxID=2637762 RepID=UPI0034265668